jgi:3-hydroxyisobutyrate dehydrogenase-like beta-hydroxyacid dehydrogenase
MTDAPRAGILGLGIIGSRVAARLHTSGIPLAVWSRSAQRIDGLPEQCATPADVARQADILQIFVSDDAAVRETIEAMLPELGARHVVLVHSTVAPDTVRSLSVEVSSRGAVLLDAPFTGSRDAAAQGQITYYIGGSPEALERARTVLAASAKAVLPVGEIGSASLVKIATNIMAAAAAVSLAEAVNLLRDNGVDPAVLPAILENNAARSGVTDLKLPSMLGQDFSPRFSARNLRKDLRLALALSSPGAASLTSAMERLYDLACAEGMADEDFASVVKVRSA